MGNILGKTSARALLFVFLGSGFGCALLGSGEDPVKKNPGIKFQPPPNPFAQSHISSADQVWQSESTGNTIAINSTCQEYSDLTLKDLQQNILGGIENLKVQSDKTVSFDGREAQRIVSVGSAEGVSISVDLLILKKNNCTYDLAYIARSKFYDDEHGIFETFLKRFHAP